MVHFFKLTESRFTPAEHEPYHLASELEGFGLDKRATQYFITLDGRATTDCHQATKFTINQKNQLVAVNGAIYATSPGVTSQQFVPTFYPSSLTSSWQLSNGIVSWRNESFQNGAAVACVNQQSNVQLYFLAAPPSTCTILTFRQAARKSGITPSLSLVADVR